MIGQRATEPGDPLQRALEISYRYLNRRDRTEAELRRHLARHGSDDTALDGAIEVLLAQGYLDDARYARLFVEDKRTLERWGRDRIERTLIERGIERELVARALAATADGATELERALALLRRRFPSPPRERRERDRALGILLRKGYESELALDALTAYARDAAEPSLR